MRLLWLPDVLRSAGVPVVEMMGWETSGTQLKAVQGIVCHHTATGPKTSDEAVERILRNGRPDLKGPLSQLGLRRDGTWVVVASGRANHNGYGEWGNDSLGVEAYNDGVGEPWPKVQYDSFVRGCRALAAHLTLSPSRVKGHKETDPRRKIDPTFDMREFRAAIASTKPTPTPSPTPAPAPEEDDVYFLFRIKDRPEVWLCSPFQRRHLKTQVAVDQWKYHLGSRLAAGGAVQVVDDPSFVLDLEPVG